jgi:ABC-type uncharacterized transport system permease subunit
VITTIMFNFIAGALLNYMLVNPLRPEGSMDPATAKFPAGTNLPTLHEMLAPFGIEFSRSAPANVSLLPGAGRLPLCLVADLAHRFGL